MENVVYYNELFDLYESLLTDKEKQTFIDYYQEDLSLSEIADNRQISRSAVSKNLNTVLDKLNYYENNLHLHLHKKDLIALLNYDDINAIKKGLEKIIY